MILDHVVQWARSRDDFLVMVLPEASQLVYQRGVYYQREGDKGEVRTGGKVDRNGWLARTFLTALLTG